MANVLAYLLGIYDRIIGDRIIFSRLLAYVLQGVYMDEQDGVK